MKIILIYLIIVFSFSIININDDKFTSLMISNPYTLGVDLLVKCDWNKEKNRYKFNKIIKVKSNTNRIILVPYGVKFCEIYPKIRFF